MAQAEAQTQAEQSRAARLERVKRIIRGLAEVTEDRGASESEAMGAAEKIGELLATYELSLDEVMLQGMKSEMVKTQVYAGDDAASSLISGVGVLCSLVVYRDTSAAGFSYVLFGHETDVELAKYLYEVCAEAAETEWVNYGNKHGFTVKARESFRMGFARRVHARMVELKQARDEERRRHVQMSGCTDLVIVKDQIVRAEFEKEGVKLTGGRSRTIHDMGSFRNGAAAGDRVNLNNPLGDQRQPVAGALR